MSTFKSFADFVEACRVGTVEYPITIEAPTAGKADEAVNEQFSGQKTEADFTPAEVADLEDSYTSEVSDASKSEAQADPNPAQIGDGYGAPETASIEAPN